MTKLISHIALYLTILSTPSLAQGFKLYDHSNSILPNAEITQIVIDKNGTKWIGAGRFGLFKMTGGKLEEITKKQSPIQNAKISCLFVDSKNNLWVSFSNPAPGLVMFDGKNWTNFSGENLLVNKSVYAIAESKLGTMYFGTGNGVAYYDQKWHTLKLPPAETDYNVLSIDLSDDGRIALGTSGYLFVFNGDNWNKYTTTNGLQVGTIRAVKFIADSLYIGYGGGLGDGGYSILSATKMQHFNKVNSNLPDQMVRDIKISKNNTIWMATNDGIYIIHPNGKTEAKKLWPGKSQNTIMEIAIDEKDNCVWLGTTKGVVKLNN